MKKTAIISIPILLGVAAFFACVGPRALDTSNIAWLVEGDFAQHYLGWVFFRNSSWTFPIGMNPDYGLEVSSSIVFSDSIPLLAFVFKALSPLLPDVFQYNGIWLLLCFILQGIFSWKLLGLITESDGIRSVGTIFFVFSPPMLWRLNGHESLLGHFLILAALYLALNKNIIRNLLGWAILATVATLVHGYLLFMVTAVWVADVLRRKINNSDYSWQRFSVEVASISGLILLVSWQAGYLMLGRSASDEGFGYYSMNLLSLFDPQSFSYILRNMPICAGQYEGNNYLGLGVLFLIPIVLFILRNRHLTLRNKFRENYLLFAVVFSLALFAVSNKICIGPYYIEIPLGRRLLGIANTWRASGRMFWPAYYLIYLSIFYIVIRGTNKRYSVILLTMALILQLADLSSGSLNIRRKLMTAPQKTWMITLASPQWEEFAKSYKKIKWYRPKEAPPLWKDISYYAAIHKMGTNAVDLARMNEKGFIHAIKKAIGNLDSGEYDKDTLYLLEDDLLERAQKGLTKTANTLQKIDGINVIAPAL